MARTKQAARKKQQDADGAAAGGDEPKAAAGGDESKKCRKLMLAGRNGQVQCVVTFFTYCINVILSQHAHAVALQLRG